MMALDLLTNIFQSFPFSARFAGRLDIAAANGISQPRNFASVWLARGDSCTIRSHGADEAFTLHPYEAAILSPAMSHDIFVADDHVLVSLDDVLTHSNTARTSYFVGDTDDVTSSLLCGIFACDGIGTHPLGWLLPPVIHFENEIAKSPEFATLIQNAERESTHPGPASSSVLHCLLEALFIQGVRRWFTAKSLTAFQGKIVPQFAELWPAVGLMHRHPERSWTVAELAEYAAMSRSAFFAAFVEAYGIPPAQYLREHRMQLASQMLRDTTLGLKEIATRTGYDSVTAFSTAFKRQIGIAPGSFRRNAVNV